MVVGVCLSSAKLHGIFFPTSTIGISGIFLFLLPKRKKEKKEKEKSRKCPNEKGTIYGTMGVGHIRWINFMRVQQSLLKLWTIFKSEYEEEINLSICFNSHQGGR